MFAHITDLIYVPYIIHISARYIPDIRHICYAIM